MKLARVTDESKCCCLCRHNVRSIHSARGCIRRLCDKDGHYIGYVANFTQVCDEYEAEEES